MNHEQSIFLPFFGRVEKEKMSKSARQISLTYLYCSKDKYLQLRKVAQVDSCRHTEVVDRQSWRLSIFVYLGAHCFMSEDAKVAQIASLTGLSAEQAKFFLDSCGGDEEAAINTYLETQAEEAVSNSGDEPDSEANQAREESSTPQRETVAKVLV